MLDTESRHGAMAVITSSSSDISSDDVELVLVLEAASDPSSDMGDMGRGGGSGLEDFGCPVPDASPADADDLDMVKLPDDFLNS